MTDNEIKKALQIHIFRGDCKECAYAKFPVGTCEKEMHKDALDLINRQNKEIERLTFERDNEHRCYLRICDDIKQAIIRNTTARAEAVKEFAERLKKDRYVIFNSMYSDFWFSEAIDNLVKEFTEGKNEDQ